MKTNRSRRDPQPLSGAIHAFAVSDHLDALDFSFRQLTECHTTSLTSSKRPTYAVTLRPSSLKIGIAVHLIW